jgi:hypothetical protein
MRIESGLGLPGQFLELAAAILSGQGSHQQQATEDKPRDPTSHSPIQHWPIHPQLQFYSAFARHGPRTSHN